MLGPTPAGPAQPRPGGVRTQFRSWLLTRPRRASPRLPGSLAPACVLGARAGGRGLSRLPGPGLSACAPFRALSRSCAGRAPLLGRDRGAQPGSGGPPGRTPAPFAAAVCTHVISSHYPGFQLADSGPESRARGELGHGATASPLEPLGPGRERLYPNSRPLASCVCVRPDVYTTTTCGHMSVFVCLMLCLHPRVLGRGGGRCARTPCRCREEGWGVGGTK